MLRVLLVDDEIEIRQGLRLKVDWEQLGFCITGEASSGKEALVQLESAPFDVMLTDMHMPLLDGAGLLDACTQHYPNLKVIVLTGYEDFGYARSALRNQARDYLLKPITRQELADALIKVKAELAEQRNRQEQTDKALHTISQYYAEMREQFIVQLVKDQHENRYRLMDRARSFDLEAWSTSQVYFVTAGLREHSQSLSASDKNPLAFSLPFELMVREDTRQLLPEMLLFHDPGYPGLMHLIVRAGEVEAIEGWKEQVRQHVQQYIGLSPSIGSGEVVSGLLNWKDGYLSSLLAWHLEEGKLADDSLVDARNPDSAALVASDAASASMSPVTLAVSSEKGLVLARLLAKGEEASLRTWLVHELTDARERSRADMMKKVFQLYLLLEGIAYEARIRLEAGDQLWLRPELAHSLHTPEKAADFLFRIAERLTAQLSATGEKEAEQSRIEAARHFIDDNYMYDLTLTMIADKYNYNPSYFSELFKEKLGKTFIQYVTEVRMNHARRLLEETTLGLWDIAEFTGFSNPSYFSSKFKKMFHQSPSEYRQRLPEKNTNGIPKK